MNSEVVNNILANFTVDLKIIRQDLEFISDIQDGSTEKIYYIC